MTDAGKLAVSSSVHRGTSDADHGKCNYAERCTQTYRLCITDRGSETRFVNFSVDVSMETKAARCISGILLYLFLMNFCYVLFLKAMGSLWGAFIGSMVIFFYFVGIHPLLFFKLI